MAARAGLSDSPPSPSLTPKPKPYTHLSVKTLLEMVRAELGPDIGDELVPMVNGGMQLHKIFGLMHDTCNTANRVAVLMAELRDRKARTFHGDAAWDAEDPCQKNRARLLVWQSFTESACRSGKWFL